MTRAETITYNTGIATAAGLARRIAETIAARSKRPLADGFAIEALTAFADEAGALLRPIPIEHKGEVTNARR